MPELLLVEDDRGLSYILKEYLELNGYSTTVAADGEAGWGAFQQGQYDLIILDVMLPHKDGFTLAKEIRQMDNQVPLIFLTAKALKVDKLKGFRIGADDYMVKPVDEEELIARIEAIFKRIRAQNKEKQSFTQFIIGDYQFDFDNQTLLLGEQKQLITKKEAEILMLLCQHMDRILDRKMTLKKIWGENDYFKRRSMDVFISRLRKYLKGDRRISITNVHGKGYILSVEENK